MAKPWPGGNQEWGAKYGFSTWLVGAQTFGPLEFKELGQELVPTNQTIVKVNNLLKTLNTMNTY